MAPRLIASRRNGLGEQHRRSVGLDCHRPRWRRLAYAKADGAARLTPKVPSTPSTRYAVDSVSKEFTAAALLLLAEQGKLSLDDPLAKWFPDLGASAAVTLRQLLAATPASIRDYWPQDFLTPEMTRPAATAAIIDEWARRPLDFEPGTDWQYSNTGYVLAGAVVEKVSGETLFEFLKQRVFTPLHMNRVTEYAPAEEDLTPTAERLGNGDAAAYTRFGLGPVLAAPKEGAGWLFGAAGLAMQPSDLALWDVSLIDRSLLQADSVSAGIRARRRRTAAPRSTPWGWRCKPSAADCAWAMRAPVPVSSPIIECGRTRRPPSWS